MTPYLGHLRDSLHHTYLISRFFPYYLCLWVHTSESTIRGEAINKMNEENQDMNVCDVICAEMHALLDEHATAQAQCIADLDNHLFGHYLECYWCSELDSSTST